MRNSIGFIAVGQGGGNIGNLFEQKGHNVLYINTSQKDLDTLTNVKHTYHIANGEGCNKDRDKAKHLIIEDFTSIMSHIEEKLSEDYIFVIFSSGGGTGSGSSPMLIDLLLQNTKKKVGVITILPSKQDSVRAYINAYECFSELEDIEKLGATFIIDNNKEDNLVSNHMFAGLFTSLIEIPEHIDTRGNVDEAEIKEILGTRGATVLAKLDKNSSSTANLIKALSDGIFAGLEQDRVIKYLALSAATTIDLDAVYKEIGVPLDAFQGRNSSDTVCVIAGLTYPYTLLDQIKQRIEQNQETVVKNLEATTKTRLVGNVNFLNPIVSESAVAEEEKPQTSQDIFAKYMRRG